MSCITILFWCNLMKINVIYFRMKIFSKSYLSPYILHSRLWYQKFPNPNCKWANFKKERMALVSSLIKTLQHRFGTILRGCPNFRHHCIDGRTLHCTVSTPNALTPFLIPQPDRKFYKCSQIIVSLNTIPRVKRANIFLSRSI